VKHIASERQLGKGCIKQPEDERDFIFEKTLGAGVVMTDKEWSDGYDIEKVLGIKLPVKNQQLSYSCVGQAFSTYTFVLNYLENKDLDQHSAKAIYSQITLGHGRGAYLRDGAKLIVDWGEVKESIVKSYKADGNTDETFMVNKLWINEEVNKLAKTFQSKEYRLITGMEIDHFARAIKDGYGMVAGVTGINNGTWTLTYPKPPKLTDAQGQMWGHAIYFGKFRIKDGKKEVGILNSWGNIGENGWQWLGEDWFADKGRWIFNPWVLIDITNNDMVFKKIKGEPSIYLVDDVKGTKTMIIDMRTLDSLGGKYEEVDNLAGYIPVGTLIYVERIID